MSLSGVTTFTTVYIDEMPTRDSEIAHYFGLPEGRRRLCFAGHPTLLRKETIIPTLHIMAEC